VPLVGEAMPVGEDVEAHLGEFGVAVGLLWSMLLVGFTGGVFSASMTPPVPAFPARRPRSADRRRQSGGGGQFYAPW
jgi:hypothetical protein